MKKLKVVGILFLLIVAIVPLYTVYATGYDGPVGQATQYAGGKKNKRKTNNKDKSIPTSTPSTVIRAQGLRVSLYEFIRNNATNTDKLNQLGNPYVLYRGNMKKSSKFVYTWICGKSDGVIVYCDDTVTVELKDNAYDKLKNPIVSASGVASKVTIYNTNDKMPKLTDKTLISFIEQNGILRKGSISNAFVGDTLNKNSSVGTKSVQQSFGLTQGLDVLNSSKYYIAVEPVAGYFKYPTMKKDGKAVSYYHPVSCMFKRVNTKTWTTSSYTHCTIGKDGVNIFNSSKATCTEKLGPLCIKWKVKNKLVYKIQDRKGTANLEMDTLRKNNVKSNYLTSVQQTKLEGYNCNTNKGFGTCNDSVSLNTASNYYIGPSAKSALVTYAKTGKQYQLLTNAQQSNVNLRTGQYTQGIAFYWLDNIINKCENYCRDKNGKALEGEELLQCAERFCDAHYSTTAQKAKCIRGIEEGETDPNADKYCNYKPQKITCDTTEENRVTGDEDPDPYKDKVAETNSSSGSCDSYTGSVKICQGCDVDGTAIENRRYYNVSCFEEGKATFKDISKTRLVAGQGLDYDVRLNVDRQCTVYFDYKSWQTDYASIASKDPLEEYYRNVLLAKLEVYNNFLLTQDYSAGVNIQYVDGRTVTIDMRGLEAILEDESTSESGAKYTEIVFNDEMNSKQYELIAKNIADKDSGVVFAGDTTFVRYSFTNYSDNGAKPFNDEYKLNMFTKTTGQEIEYKMPYQCLTNDNNATVYDLKCQTKTCVDNKNKLCEDSTVAKQLYYTNLNATPNKEFTNSAYEHKATGNAKITNAATSNTYLNVTDTCPYEIEASKSKCIVTVESGNKIGKGIYKGAVTFRVTISDSVASNEITGIDVEVKNSAGKVLLNQTDIQTNSDGKGYLITINDQSNKLVPCNKEADLIVNGNVRMKDEESTCTFEYKQVGEDCGGLNCEIKRAPLINNENKNLDPEGKINLFEITSNKTGASYYSSINNSSFVKIEKTTKNLTYNPNAGVVFKSENKIEAYYKSTQIKNSKGKYYINVTELDKFTILGKVQVGSEVAYCSLSVGNSCTNLYSPTQTEAIRAYCDSSYAEDEKKYVSADVCYDDCTNNDTPKECTKLFDCEEKDKIKEYCAEHWSEDVADYKSAEDCENVCGDDRRKCDLIVISSNNNGYAQLINQCEVRYNELGFSSAANCANTCCTVLGNCPRSGNDYVYRPIKTSNPFPKSYLDKQNKYNDKVERIVGGNWFGKEFYINPNLYDFTQSIPDGKIATEPEYVVELDQERIKAIRQDNENYNSSDEDANVYLDYVCIQENKNKNGVCEGRYESDFIRESSFGSYFTKVLDVKIKAAK